MAIIGTIRKNGWILIVMMVLALGGFILMDVVSNSQRYSAGDVNSLGKINDTEVKRDEFEQYEQLIYTNARNNTFQVRAQIWDYFLEKALVEQEAKEIGIGVGKKELLDLQFGDNISPVIAERFRDGNGQIDRATLMNIKQNIEGGTFTDPTNRAYWAVQEKEIVKERLQDKIMKMISKGVYTPQWEAEAAFKDNNTRFNATYVRIPFSKVKDEEAPVTDADYKAFLADNPGLYDQEDETRTIGFVAIEVIPTSEDSAAARNGINALVDGLRAAENDSAYVVANGGTFDGSYQPKSALPAGIADTLLRMPVKSVVGPYLNGNVWTVAKIMDRKIVADSVQARHILRQGATPASEKTIDSLMALLNSKQARFDSLAVRNSQDPGSGSKGGDLGWFAPGQMVPEFNNVCFYEAEIGKYYKVKTQFGWHLIEVTNRKFIKNEASVKAAYLTKAVEPGNDTQRAAKDRALKIAQQAKNLDDLSSIAGKENLPVQYAPELKANDFNIGPLGAGDASREIVRWTFDEKTDEGAISKDIFTYRDPAGGYFDSRYVVVGLKSIAPAGEATVATLKANPRADAEVKNRKKGEAIVGKIKNANDMNAVAAQFGLKVDTLTNVSMLQTFVPNGGSEPKIIGHAFALGKGKVSKPLIGVSGVYVISPITDKTQPPLPPDLTMFRRQVASTANSAIRMSLMNTMKKKAEVKDNRSRFF